MDLLTHICVHAKTCARNTCPCTHGIHTHAYPLQSCSLLNRMSGTHILCSHFGPNVGRVARMARKASWAKAGAVARGKAALATTRQKETTAKCCEALTSMMKDLTRILHEMKSDIENAAAADIHRMTPPPSRTTSASRDPQDDAHHGAAGKAAIESYGPAPAVEGRRLKQRPATKREP